MRNLEKRQNAEPLFQSVPPVTLLSSFKALWFNLYDEQSRKLISFRELDQMRKQGQTA